MSRELVEFALAVFLVFCRIGGCLMVMPGFSSARFPMQARLFLIIALSFALTPLIQPVTGQSLVDMAPTSLMLLIGVELGLGLLIGLMGRYFFLGLQFIAVAIASFSGVGTMPSTAIDDGEPAPAIATLITLTAVMLMFVTDLHLEIVRALVDSYAVIPLAQGLDFSVSIERLQTTLSTATFLALQISAPFIIYSMIVNFAFGLANKLTPQIPVYFISLPFVIAGGLFVLYFTIGEFLGVFVESFSLWLANG